MAKRAMIVGINTYQDPRNNLPSCLADAEAMRALLGGSYGFDIAVDLRDTEASKARMLAGLQTLLASPTSDDEFVFFYSGHGYSFMQGEAYIEALVPQDANFLTSDDLAAATAGLPSGASLTVVLDSCYSGGMQKAFLAEGGAEAVQVKFWTPPTDTKAFLAGSRILSYRAFGSPECRIEDTALIGTSTADTKAFSLVNPQPTNGAKRQFILFSACQADETAAASTSRTEGRSAFTFALLKQLAGAEAARMPVDALLDQAGQNLRALGVRQTPMLKVPDVPARLADCAFLSWTNPLASQVGSKTKGAVFSLADRSVASPMKGFAMNDALVQKDWLSDIAGIVTSVVPVVSAAIGGSKGFEPAAPAPQVDKAWFDELARTVATVIPAVVQGLQTVPPPSKGFQVGDDTFDKGWFDSVTAVTAAVLPHVLAAIKTSQAPGMSGLRANAEKGWFSDITSVVAHVAPIVISAVAQSKAGAPTKGFQPDVVDDKSFLSVLGSIAKIAVPIAMTII